MISSHSPSSSSSSEFQRARDTAEGDVLFAGELAAMPSCGEISSRCDEQTKLQRLSPRERQVLTLLADGCSTKEIAARLGVSIKTAETHRRNITEKLQIDSVALLTKFAVRVGLSSLTE